MTTPALPGDDRTSREDPWPGLRSYEEAERVFFHGRRRETAELLRLVKRDVLTLFFGISGIGKSSLLQAGVFPALRVEGYLPVRVRLNVGASDNLGRDVIRAFETEAATQSLTIHRGADPLPADAPVTMWEYFHRVRVWDHADPVTPVLVFDQFEEVFTLGGGAGAVSPFLTELADLVENQIPMPVRRQIDQTRRPPAFAVDETPYRVVIALREDYLANLEGLTTLMPSLSKRNKFRLLPMTVAQALEAILGPGAGLVTEAVATQIVGAIGFTRRSTERTAGDDDEIEPFLLSLVCRELNTRRQERKLSMISADLVQSSHGGVGSILRDFYDRSFADLPAAVREFVEDRLVGRSGFRQMVAVADVQDVADLWKPVQTLVARRLLRIEENRAGVPHIELTHDVLTPIAVASRNQRAVAEETARALQADRAKRARIVAAAAALVGIALTLLLIVAVWQWRVAVREGTAAQTARGQAEQSAEQSKQAQEAAEAARTSAQLALQALQLQQASAPSAAPSQQVRQLQERAQTDLASSSRSDDTVGPSGAVVPSTAPRSIEPRVYFQVRSQGEADDVTRRLMPLLKDQRFVVPRPEVLSTGPNSTEVRFFRSGEREGADRIVNILKQAGIANAQPKYVAGYEDSLRIRQNHFEVWLAPGQKY